MLFHQLPRTLGYITIYHSIYQIFIDLSAFDMSDNFLISYHSSCSCPFEFMIFLGALISLLKQYYLLKKWEMTVFNWEPPVSVSQFHFYSLKILESIVADPVIVFHLPGVIARGEHLPQTSTTRPHRDLVIEMWFFIYLYRVSQKVSHVQIGTTRQILTPQEKIIYF